MSSTGQVTYKMSPKLGLVFFLSFFFSWLDWGYCFLEKLIEVKCTSHHVMAGAIWYLQNITGGINRRHHLINVVWPFSQLYNYYFSFLLLYPLKVSQVLCPRGGSVYIHYLEFFSKTDSSPLPHLLTQFTSLLSENFHLEF